MPITLFPKMNFNFAGFRLKEKTPLIVLCVILVASVKILGEVN
jgi:hypothetical protein